MRTIDLGAITLLSGGHTTRDDGMCALEAVAWLAGEEHSDHPACVSLVIAAFVRAWNDALSDADRNRLLKPLLPELIGTRTTADDEETRAWMASDWLARVYTPAWLRLAGLEDRAHALEATARIIDATTARAAQPTLDAARDASVAAWDAAWAAAWDAASAAASAVAWAAGTSRLAPGVAALQASAVELLVAMCAVGRSTEPVVITEVTTDAE